MSTESFSEIISTIPFLEIVQSIPFTEIVSVSLPPSEIKALSLSLQTLSSSLSLALTTIAGTSIVMGILGVQKIVDGQEKRGMRWEERKRERERREREREKGRWRRYEVLKEDLGVREGGMAGWLVDYLEGVKREKEVKRMLVFYDCEIVASQVRRLAVERYLDVEVFTEFDGLLVRAAKIRASHEIDDETEMHISIPILKSTVLPLRFSSDIGELGKVEFYGIQGLDGENLVELAISQSLKADMSKIVFRDVAVLTVETYDPDEIIYTTFGRSLNHGGKALALSSLGLFATAGCVIFLGSRRRSASSLAFVGASVASAYFGLVGWRKLGDRIRDGGHSTRRGGW